MKYRDRTTGQVYTLAEIQQKFSSVSFPLVWDSTTFDFANVDAVTIVSQPAVSDSCKRMDYTGVQFINNQWIETWNEVPLYDDPTEQSVCEAELVESQWDRIRNQRNLLLSETDYTQLSDAQITAQCKTNFQTYRQQLRDVTNQIDPYNIVWPTPPIYEKE